jgi:sulfur carrier protein ThiS
MQILLNGESREIPGPTTVRDLLTDLGIDARMVAVELNRTGRQAGQARRHARVRGRRSRNRRLCRGRIAPAF